MGMSGEEYDRQYPQYQPNKDRNIAAWKAKKKKEREEQKTKTAAEGAVHDRKKYGTDAERREDEAVEKQETPAPIPAKPVKKSRKKAFSGEPDEWYQPPLPFD